MKKWTWSAALVVLSVALGPLLGAVGQENPSAREQLQECVAQLKNDPENEEVRERIIKLALTIKPAPAVPDEAAELVGGGKHLMKEGKTKLDFADAVKKFQQASNVAPWVADIYYNLAVAQQSAEQFDDAVKSFRLYLLAKPDASDHEAVLERIGACKTAAEQNSPEAIAEREAREARAQAEKKQQEERRFVESLDGSRYSCFAPGFRNAYGRRASEAIALDIRDGQADMRDWQDPRAPGEFEESRVSLARGPVTGKQFFLEVNDYDPTQGWVLHKDWLARCTISDDGAEVVVEPPSPGHWELIWRSYMTTQILKRQTSNSDIEDRQRCAER
jgi:tetratricopeptide (TPR) repeat protein